MDPVTMGIVATTLLGGILKGNAAKRAAAAQAAQDEFNAKLSDTAAGDALLRGLTAEGAVARATSDAVSTGRAQLGASGVDTQSGSAVDSLAGLRARGQLAALVIRQNAAREAWGDQGQAANFRARAKNALQSGSDQYIGELLSAGASALQAYQKGKGFDSKGGESASEGPGTPGIDTPIIRVGEPTTAPVPFGEQYTGDY